jgi:hypothetical protein
VGARFPKEQIHRLLIESAGHRSLRGFGEY